MDGKEKGPDSIRAEANRGSLSHWGKPPWKVQFLQWVEKATKRG